MITKQATNRNLAYFENLYFYLQNKGFKKLSRSLNEKDPSITKINVGWGHAVVGKDSIALGTRGVAVCSALTVIDPTAENLQYMLHVTPHNNPEDINQSLLKARSLGINLKDSVIEVMPGERVNELTTPAILEALYKIDPSLIEKVVLIRDYEARYCQALVTYKGHTYKYSYPPEDQHDCNDAKCLHTLDQDGYEKVL